VSKSGYADFSNIGRAVIRTATTCFMLSCEGKDMIINGIDVGKHLASRFEGAIAEDKIARCVLFFDNSTMPKLLATRAYGNVPDVNGTVVSVFNWESDPKICMFEFNLNLRLQNVRDLENYKYSIIIGRTQEDWATSSYVHKYNLAHKPIRPNRELVAGILKGMNKGSLYNSDPKPYELGSLPFAEERGTIVPREVFSTP